MAKQRVRARKIATQANMGLLMAPKTSAVAPSTSKINKVILEDTLENLIKNFKKLKMKMSG